MAAAMPTVSWTRRWRGAISVAIALALAAGIWALLSRPVAGGPLTSASTGVVVDAFPAGSTVTFGLQLIGNSGSSVITVTSVTPRLGDPAPEVLGDAALLGPERTQVLGFGMFDVLAGWPPAAGLNILPADGATIPAGESSQFEVVLPLRVPDTTQKVGMIDGFTVEYEAGNHRYRYESDTVLVLCPNEDPTACAAYSESRH